MTKQYVICSASLIQIDIQVNPKDLKIETYKSSGAGGQHVQTTDSAVRIRHLPSGMYNTVSCGTVGDQCHLDI